MRTRETGALMALALGLSITGGAVAGMYKWVDQQGAVHYTQTPPPDRTAQELAPPPPPPKPAEPEARAGTGDTAPGEEASPAKPPQEPENARKMRFQQNCTAARNNLQLYQTARRIMDGGQLVILTDEEKARRIEKAKEQIERYCSD